MADSDEIWYADAEPDADDNEEVKMETGSRISIWRPFVFKTRKISQLRIEISCRNLERK